MLSSSSEDSSNFFLGCLFSLDRGTLSSVSDWDDEEEEEGDASDSEEPWGGVVEDDVLPPVSIWFGMVVRLSNASILQVEPGFGGVITARTNGVVGITPRL